MAENKPKPKAGKKLPNEGVADKKKKRVKKRVETYNIVFNELCKTGNSLLVLSKPEVNDGEGVGDLPNGLDMEDNVRHSDPITPMYDGEGVGDPLNGMDMEDSVPHSDPIKPMNDGNDVGDLHNDVYKYSVPGKKALQVYARKRRRNVVNEEFSSDEPGVSDKPEQQKQQKQLRGAVTPLKEYLDPKNRKNRGKSRVKLTYNWLR